MRNFIHPQEFMSEVRNFLKCGKAFENGLIFEGDPNDEQGSEYVAITPFAHNNSVVVNFALSVSTICNIVWLAS